LPETSKPNDLVFWHTDLTVDHIDDFAATLRGHSIKLVSNRVVNSNRESPCAHRSFIVRDPDGHALEFLQESVEATASVHR
jgi:hypothetical protein